jgi:hypothetical protein
LCGNVEISFCLQFLHCLSTLPDILLPQPAAGAPGGGGGDSRRRSRKGKETAEDDEEEEEEKQCKRIVSFS